MTHHADQVVQIIADAGGRIVGRTKLQKVAYLLNAAGLDKSFKFEYKHYGPYSEGLAEATQIAAIFGDITQEERSTAWGGSFFVFTTLPDRPQNSEPSRVSLIAAASAADAVDLELAATAVFLYKAGFKNPWAETARRKPEKAANEGLSRAKALYQRLKEIPAPDPLPPI